MVGERRRCVRGREGKGREGKGREGKGREGKGREGKGRESVQRADGEPSWCRRSPPLVLFVVLNNKCCWYAFLLPTSVFDSAAG
jgi:hypothetical protein